MSTAENVTIPAFYNEGDVDNLFGGVYHNFETWYATNFAARKNLNLDEPIKLAMELPEGAFIAGGFIRSIKCAEPTKDYDIFFNGSEAVAKLLRRIQHAPEGSFLHGYTSVNSFKDFASGSLKYITFTHASKPSLQLVRVRWFDRADVAIDKFDMSFSQFALDHKLALTFSTQGWEDIVTKRARLLGNVVFPLSTGFRLKRFIESGWQFSGDSYSRDEYIRLANQHIEKLKKKAVKAGQPASTNVEGFGSFELYGED